jgi:hypothetical protein
VAQGENRMTVGRLTEPAGFPERDEAPDASLSCREAPRASRGMPAGRESTVGLFLQASCDIL